MAQLTQAIVLVLAAALALILVQHGWPGVKAKASAIFLGKARPDLVNG